MATSHIMDNPQKFDHIYMPGLENRLYRYYYYLNAGLNIVNNFRNLILALLGFYYVLKLDMPWLLPVMFLISAVILTIVGYYVVHRVNKVSEWLGIRFSSHYAIKQFNFQEGIYNTLQEINEKLGKTD